MTPPADRPRAAPIASGPIDRRQSDSEAIDEAVRALGHPGRRAMLRLARERECSASELAETAGLSASAASQHLKVLRDAGLVHVRVDARRRLYRVDPERLAAVRAALDSLWDDRLAALAQAAARGAGRSAQARGRSA